MPDLSPEPFDSGIPYKSLNEECGVFGILERETRTLGHIIYYGLYALQHRGQESCGMAVFDNHQLRLHKDMGLVNQVFSEKLLNSMTGQIGIGHTRYSTTGSSNLDNAQPVVARSPLGALTLAHNGNLINTETLRAFLSEHNFFGHGNSDSHLMVQYVNYLLSQGQPLQEAIIGMLKASEGAYSLVLATGDTLIAARDPHGLRPLCMGKTENGAIVVASETCALDIVGATYEREIEPGEVLIATLDGRIDSLRFTENPQNHLCVFELVYFARPDSQIHGASVYTYRMNLGRQLAKISPPVDADIVIPVPDSGNVAAVGYSQESGVPYVEGLIKNRYVGRTFIHPTPEMRDRGIRLKLNPLTDILKDKRVIVVDDSIVRGNTSRKLVKMLRQAGVKEVHLRISSAQVKHPCFYGIDMSSEEQLIANRMDVPALTEWLDADSLVYLSVQDMLDVAGFDSHCTACFSNVYPAGKPSAGEISLQKC